MRRGMTENREVTGSTPVGATRMIITSSQKPSRSFYPRGFCLALVRGGPGGLSAPASSGTKRVALRHACEGASGARAPSTSRASERGGAGARLHEPQAFADPSPPDMQGQPGLF